MLGRWSGKAVCVLFLFLLASSIVIPAAKATLIVGPVTPSSIIVPVETTFVSSSSTTSIFSITPIDTAVGGSATLSTAVIPPTTASVTGASSLYSHTITPSTVEVTGVATVSIVIIMPLFAEVSAVITGPVAPSVDEVIPSRETASHTLVQINPSVGTQTAESYIQTVSPSTATATPTVGTLFVSPSETHPMPLTGTVTPIVGTTRINGMRKVLTSQMSKIMPIVGTIAIKPWAPTPPTPDFTIEASPYSLTIERDGSDVSTLIIRSLSGFNQPVELAVTSPPISGVSITLDPLSVIPSPDGYVTSILTMNIASNSMPDIYTITVTGTSDTLTHSVNISLKITAPLTPEEWTFALITDLHIGRGYSDYDREGWNDANSQGQDYYLTDRLKRTVDWIITNRENRHIKFVVVLGDIADSAEYSEFDKAKAILSRLDDPDGDPNTNDAVPYVPLIGNHDVWPYTDSSEADYPESDFYFRKIFIQERLPLLESYFENWESPLITQEVTWGLPGFEKKWTAFLQNYAFSYKGMNFIALDFAAREPVPTDKGVGPDAVLWTSTLNWLTQNLKENQPSIILSHHPLVTPWGGFDPWEIITIDEAIKISKADVSANFAGHRHGFDLLTSMDANKIYSLGVPEGVSVVTTEALMVASNEPVPKGIIRVVKVNDGEITIPFEVDGEFRALNPSFKVDEGWLRVGKTLVEFEAYAFTKRFTNEYPLTYIIAFGDNMLSESKTATEKVQFKHAYENGGYYDVTLMVIGWTPDGKEKITEKITQRIYVNPPVDTAIFVACPVDMAVTDPDGLMISKQLNEILGATYAEVDFDKDGQLDDIILIPDRKAGDYRIALIPEPDAAPTDTYTLEVLGLDATIILAENVLISDTPTEPYIFSSTTLDIPPTTLLVIGEPEFVVDDIACLTSATSIVLIAQDNPGGSGVDSTVYRIHSVTYDSGWIAYTQLFNLNGLIQGTYQIDFNSTDNAGNVESTNTVTVVLDNTPPITTLTVGSPKYVTATTYVTSETLFTLEANDNIGSGVYSLAYRIHNSTYDSGWLPYTASFYLKALSDGVYTIEFNSTDNLSNVEPSNAVTVILDNAEPSITVENPPTGWALQDGVTFIVSGIETGSGVLSIKLSIREENGGEGKPVGFEDLLATYDATIGKWTLFFNTLQLPDGYYVVIVEAKDNLGHTSSTTVSYSIRNWAVLELLPATENNKAGRTMPVKFSLRVAASIDPNQPFVYNEELAIKIYAINDLTNILQTSEFGDTAKDYRIDKTNEKYITNFQTLKTPMQYTVEVYRGAFLIGSFNFKTVK